MGKEQKDKVPTQFRVTNSYLLMLGLNVAYFFSFSHKQNCRLFVMKHLYISYALTTFYQPKFIIKILYRVHVRYLGWIKL